MRTDNHLIDQLFAGAADGNRIFATQAGRAPITYGDLESMGRRIAANLQNAGVSAGDRVAVQVEKSIENIALYLGTVMAGGVYLPLNTAYTQSELAYFVGDAEPAAIVCDPSREQSIGAIAGGASVLTLDAVGNGSLFEVADDDGFAPAARDGDDNAAILYTSGTTGRSKGAVLSHRALTSNALTLIKYWQITGDDCLIHALPIYHTHGLFVAINSIMIAGGSMRFHPAFNAEAILADLADASLLMGVPTFYTRLLDQPGLNRESTKKMRLFISGSAPLLAQTHDDWRERTGHAIVERYGMTETNMNTSNPLDGPRKAGTVGLPLPEVDVIVTHPETGEKLPQGETGSIEVRGPNLFKGYWRMPEKTKEDMRDNGFFITGDMGSFDEDGYLSIVGRSKDLIITGGFNVYPKEIESVLDDCEGVLESAVIGVPHPDFGEGVVGIVVAEPGKAPDIDAIRATLAEKLAKFKQPKQIVLLPELPRNAMGKVQKKALRDRFAGLLST